MTNKFLALILFITAYSFISCNSDSNLPSEPIKVVIEGATVAPNVGGSNQPNQVYVDLSTNTSKAVKRDSWDLGFYSGDDFRVVINGSIYMAAAALNATDINAVTSSSKEVEDLKGKVAVGSTPVNIKYIDAPNGDITGTAISEVSSVIADNKVYLINLGFTVGTETPKTGSVDILDDPRGWKKIRVLRDGNNYLLQYADLDDAKHQEVLITKEEAYNFTFFSFNTGATLKVEPEKEQWDLNFTVFTNEIKGYGAYGYSDFIVNNLKAGTKVYMIDTEKETLTYEAFALTDVDVDKFSNDQRAIGSSWRNGGGPGKAPSLKENVFYVLSDADGNLYKLKFLAMTNEAGERGYPQFVYSLLK